MPFGFLSYDRRSDREVNSLLKKMRKATTDLTPFLVSVAEELRQSRKAIFKLESRGAYPELNKRYKKRKQKEVGFAYPILKRTGRLEKSVTEEGGENIAEIKNKRVLIFGTEVPYSSYHQKGKGVPLRKFLFIGADETRSGLRRGLQRMMKSGNINLFREMGFTQAEAIKEANKVRYDT